MLVLTPVGRPGCGRYSCRWEKAPRTPEGPPAAGNNDGGDGDPTIGSAEAAQGDESALADSGDVVADDLDMSLMQRIQARLDSGDFRPSGIAAIRGPQNNAEETTEIHGDAALVSTEETSTSDVTGHPSPRGSLDAAHSGSLSTPQAVRAPQSDDFVRVGAEESAGGSAVALSPEAVDHSAATHRCVGAPPPEPVGRVPELNSRGTQTGVEAMSSSMEPAVAGNCDHQPSPQAGGAVAEPAAHHSDISEGTTLPLGGGDGPSGGHADAFPDEPEVPEAEAVETTEEDQATNDDGIENWYDSAAMCWKEIMKEVTLGDVSFCSDADSITVLAKGADVVKAQRLHLRTRLMLRKGEERMRCLIMEEGVYTVLMAECGTLPMLDASFGVLVWSSGSGKKSVRSPEGRLLLLERLQDAFRQSCVTIFKDVFQEQGDSAGLSCLCAADGTQERKELQLDSTTAPRVLQSVWRSFEANIAEKRRRKEVPKSMRAGLYVHAHGQKEILRRDEEDPYLMQWQKLIEWSQVAGLEISIGTKVAVPRGEDGKCWSIFATRGTSMSPLVPRGSARFNVGLCPFLYNYEHGCRRRHLPEDHLPPEFVVRRNSLWSDESSRPLVTRWLVYCGGVHSFRSEIQRTHPFDYHRMLTVLMAPDRVLDGGGGNKEGRITAERMKSFAVWSANSVESVDVLRAVNLELRLEISYAVHSFDPDFHLGRYAAAGAALNRDILKTPCTSAERGSLGPSLLCCPSDEFWKRTGDLLKKYLAGMRFIIQARIEKRMTARQAIAFALFEAMSYFCYSGRWMAALQLATRAGCIRMFRTTGQLVLPVSRIDGATCEYTGEDWEDMYQMVMKLYETYAPYSMRADTARETSTYAASLLWIDRLKASHGNTVATRGILRSATKDIVEKALLGDIKEKMNGCTGIRGRVAADVSVCDVRKVLCGADPNSVLITKDGGSPVFVMSKEVLSPQQISECILSPECKAPKYAMLQPCIERLNAAASANVGGESGDPNVPSGPFPRSVMVTLLEEALSSAGIRRFPKLSKDRFAPNVKVLCPVVMPSSELAASCLRQVTHLKAARRKEIVLREAVGNLDAPISCEEKAMLQLCEAELIRRGAGPNIDVQRNHLCILAAHVLCGERSLKPLIRTGLLLWAARFIFQDNLSLKCRARIGKACRSSMSVSFTEAAKFWSTAVCGSASTRRPLFRVACVCGVTRLEATEQSYQDSLWRTFASGSESQW